jgi:ornithine cyclodeaminase/alanine dehydrogenase
MTLLLDHDQVLAHLDMEELVAVLERGLHEQAAGELVMPPRLNVPMREGLLRMMPVALNASGLFGFKVFHTSRTGARYLVAVYEQASGELLALVDGDHLTAARTGATAGVAARYLAREDAVSVGVIGAGEEARTNFAAIAAVRPVREARVYSPRPARRSALAEEIAQRDGVAAQPVDSPEDAVAGVDIVIVATNTMTAPDPIAFRGAWIEPGMHISSIGSTMPILRELDVETFARADRLVVDAPDQMAAECGDVIAALSAGAYEDPLPLDAIVAGRLSGRRSPEEVTLFKSVGTAMQDVLGAFAVLRAAQRSGRGEEYDLLHLKAFDTAVADRLGAARTEGSPAGP